MKKVVAFFNKSSIVALATIITILGGGGIYGGINWLFKGKKPYYTTKNMAFNISDVDLNFSPSNLELYYIDCSKNNINNCERKQINTITKTTILLWNGGLETIREGDIKHNPIKIRNNNNVEVLEISLLNVENAKSNLKFDKKARIINFGFLEFKQGALIQIFHTGYGDNNIVIDGYVVDSRFDSGQWKKIKSSQLYHNSNLIVYIILFFTTITLSFVLIYKKRNNIIEYLNKDNKNLWLIFYCYFSYIILMIFIVFFLPITIMVAVQEKNLPFFLGIPEKSYRIFMNQ